MFESSETFFTFQVLGKSLHLTTDYLRGEEKVVVANSKMVSIEAKSSKLRKELKDALKVEKKLVIQKDEEVQTTLLKMDKEREKVIEKFLESNCFYDL